ncbi:MAG: aldo/keto reductase [Oscillospiraceae bacterium]|nr:aldo/keto reductase [Oscillospiraceae bacterium]
MFTANEKRYEKMVYKYCGKSGLKLPLISLGLWHNFGYTDNFANMEEMCRVSFDNGITHFDLANNYGSPYGGSAEENFGKILDRGLRLYRDELIISTKAGYGMWEGPYGDWGLRKYLIASLDQSLKRMKLEYADIFYHHRPDPDTPIEETALALDQIVRMGKALYVGLSNYKTEQMQAILPILRELKVPFIINQPSYSMLNRWLEGDGLDKLAIDEGFGLAVFSPLYQGFLTSRYLNGVPEDSRIGKGRTWIADELNEAMIIRLNKLNDIAGKREQSLSQMALSWVLSNPAVTSVIIGASSAGQIIENIEAAYKTEFTDDEKSAIEELL